MRSGRHQINRWIGSLLGRFGYEVRRKGQLHADPFEDQRVLLRGRDVRVILDLGANVGQTARRYRGLFPAATIHSFEPFEDSYRALAEAGRGDPNAHAHRLAVTDAPGPRALFRNRSSATNSLLPAAAAAGEYLPDDLVGSVGTVEVPATTLDEFCGGRGVDRVDILKMDIQGGELMALRGAAGLLGAGGVGLIFTEVLFAPLYEGQAGFCDLAGFLAERDYTLYALYDLTTGLNGVLAWGDAIFIAPHLREALAGGRGRGQEGGRG